MIDHRKVPCSLRLSEDARIIGSTARSTSFRSATQLELEAKKLGREGLIIVCNKIENIDKPCKIEM